MTRFVAWLLLLAAAPPTAEMRYFRYVRPVVAVAPGQSCLALDPALYPHAALQLADLRLYHDGVELPYALRTPEVGAMAEQTLTPLNLGMRHDDVVFDAEMPAGRYSDLVLDVRAQDFLASVKVSSKAASGHAAVELGTFTIFDFTSQRLGRSTVLHLPPSDLARLHFAMHGPLLPGNVAGLVVQRVPESKPVYRTIVQSEHFVRQGRSTTTTLIVPPHLPVDRVTFVPGSQPANFSRRVSLEVDREKGASDDAEPLSTTTYSGSLLRLHRSQDGRRIDEEQLSLEVSFAASEEASRWKVTVDNGDDAPVQFAAVRLEGLERQLCYDAVARGDTQLYYGDAALMAPRYDYANLFAAGAELGHASAGAEQANPRYVPRADNRPFSERYPRLLWVGLLFVIVLLGLIAVRSVRHEPSPSG